MPWTATFPCKFNFLAPGPQFKYWIYALKDWDNPQNLDAIYKARKAEADGHTQWEFLNGMDIYLDPGKYFIVVGLDCRKEELIPKGYVREAILFAVSVYTENDTCLEEIK
jgi:hypothetical protein